MLALAFPSELTKVAQQILSLSLKPRHFSCFRCSWECGYIALRAESFMPKRPMTWIERAMQWQFALIKARVTPIGENEKVCMIPGPSLPRRGWEHQEIQQWYNQSIEACNEEIRKQIPRPPYPPSWCRDQAGAALREQLRATNPIPRFVDWDKMAEFARKEFILQSEFAVKQWREAKTVSPVGPPSR